MSILSDYLAGSPELKRLRQLLLELKEVLESDKIDWETKYDLVFATHQKEVKPLLMSAGLRLEYCDPDTSYEEDARAYVSGLEDCLNPTPMED